MLQRKSITTGSCYGNCLKKKLVKNWSIFHKVLSINKIKWTLLSVRLDIRFANSAFGPDSAKHVDELRFGEFNNRRDHWYRITYESLLS
jgi:hypothetical protein